MAQMQPEKVASSVQQSTPEKIVAKVDYNKKLAKNNNKQQINAASYNINGGSFKFNVQAPEFVPKSHATIPISRYIYPYFQYVNTTTTTNDWIYGGDQETISFVQEPSFVSTLSQKDILPEELRLKVIKQVEYQHSDMSLLANESLLKQMNKDPKGFVPISSVSATKKIKSLITNNQLTLSHALLSSSKLIVSDDGKKVKRKIPFTDKDKEELMLRTVVAENLPDDHSHHNIEKIFNVAGSVKTIRVCHPQDPNTRTRGDLGISSKLHALIEFEHPEAAEKAAEKLNDERNWRKGLRVKLLLRRSPKSVLKSRKSAFDGCFDDEDWLASELTDDSNHTNHSEIVDNNVEETLATKKTWGKGRVRARQRNQMFNGRGLLVSSPQSSSSSPFEAPLKQATKGRMPDGTKGFTMGRGKPLNINVQTGVHVV
ncbi:la-related protein 6C-like [Nicotiana tabacum]|uniref:La-related protein 6C-like n=1 Tax=Nicotiana tabacum TaxID=4097 RepID=A0A1S4DND6_TOBAC|nr:PREDICTED: la-related protein 6C-like [Nicotiana tabacum]